MVERQLRRRGITDAAVLAAFRAVPRELFVADDLASLAYGDHPLPIACGQTISQPYIVGLMIAAAGVRAGQRVLEIGSGSGYAAAVLAQIAAEVVGVERHELLATQSRDLLAWLGIANVTIVCADGTLGWAAGAPYESILVAASGRTVPESLIAQLAPGGALVMPLGRTGGAQTLVRITKRADSSLCREELGAVRFVPLIGAEGWQAETQ